MNHYYMTHRTSISIAALAMILVAVFGFQTKAASLVSVTDSLSDLAPNKTAVQHTITFKPVTSIAAPGDLKITFASEFDLSSVASSADVTVSGGGVTWVAPQDSDVNPGNKTILLNWSGGTLTSGSTVTVTVDFMKNPASSGNYNLTVAVGPDGFVTPTDSRIIPISITGGDVAVSADVAYPPTNPTITAIVPTPTMIISSNATQVITFVLTDVNNENLDYTITPSTGMISVAPRPATPVANTKNGVTITFTYFANGLTGAQTITLTADDNEAVGGGVVTVIADLFIT